MRNRVLLPCVLAVSVWAQSDDPKEILVRVRDNLMQTIARMPRYMCTQTIDRATYHPDLGEQRLSCDDLLSEKNRASLKLATTDRLRLDVAIAASNEIYSWVGEDRFDDRDLFQLVRQGAVQNGSFSTFLVSIFEGSSANFTYNGDTTVNG